MKLPVFADPAEAMGRKSAAPNVMARDQSRNGNGP